MTHWKVCTDKNLGILSNWRRHLPCTSLMLCRRTNLHAHLKKIVNRHLVQVTKDRNFDSRNDQAANTATIWRITEKKVRQKVSTGLCAMDGQRTVLQRSRAQRSRAVSNMTVTKPAKVKANVIDQVLATITEQRQQWWKNVHQNEKTLKAPVLAGKQISLRVEAVWSDISRNHHAIFERYKTEGGCRFGEKSVRFVIQTSKRQGRSRARTRSLRKQLPFAQKPIRTISGGFGINYQIRIRFSSSYFFWTIRILGVFKVQPHATQFHFECCGVRDDSW